LGPPFKFSDKENLNGTEVSGPAGQTATSGLANGSASSSKFSDKENLNGAEVVKGRNPDGK